MTKASTLAPRPNHIPEAAVYPFDIFFDEALLKNPHARALELLRDAPPLFWTPHHGGHWMVTRFEDAHAILRQPELFSSDPQSPEQKQLLAATVRPGAPRLPQLTPILMDPPEHTRYRLPLIKAFGPKTISTLKDDITELASQLIDAVVDQGACEFISAVAEQFPVRIFLKMMGLPAERLAEFRDLVRAAFAPNGNDPMVYGMRLRKTVDAMMDVIQARRLEPKSDLISQLWAMEVDGQSMTLELMEDYSALLFLAGLDTVINAISFGMYHLARNPNLQATLRKNPTLIPDAVEEMLRRYTFTVPVRRVVQEICLHGFTIKANERVILYLPSADLDPKQFPDADVFDVTRGNKTHMAFGVGPHHCLGAHLARLELQTLYQAVLERLPAFRVDIQDPIRFHAGQMLVIASLPLRWD